MAHQAGQSRHGSNQYRSKATGRGNSVKFLFSISTQNRTWHSRPHQRPCWWHGPVQRGLFVFSSTLVLFLLSRAILWQIVLARTYIQQVWLCYPHHLPSWHESSQRTTAKAVPSLRRLNRFCWAKGRWQLVRRWSEDFKDAKSRAEVPNDSDHHKLVASDSWPNQALRDRKDWAEDCTAR